LYREAAGGMIALRKLRPLLMVAEALACAYVGYMAFLMSGWMIDDDVAFRLTSTGWTRIAVERVAFWALVGVGFGAAVIVANRYAVPRAERGTDRASLWLGIFCAATIGCASAVGAILFIVEKPFI
jgi:hypothetical protein